MSEEPEAPGKDSLPKMFIICGIIAALLFAVVLGVIIFDFMNRNKPVPPAAPTTRLAQLTTEPAHENLTRSGYYEKAITEEEASW